MNKVILAVASLSFTAAIAGTDVQPPPAGEGEQHGDASQRLRAIMQRISHTAQDSNSVATAADELTGGDMADMVEAVEELLYHAELMTTETPRRELAENRVVVFRALASQLYTEALNVRDIARSYDPGRHDFNLLNAAYDRLYQTCSACHELFREPH